MKYWSANTTDKVARVSPEGATWRSFCSQFTEARSVPEMTRIQFLKEHRAKSAIAHRIKTSTGIYYASRFTKPVVPKGISGLSHFDGFSLLVFDFDGSSADFSKGIVEHAGEVKEALAPYNFIIHHTAGSSPEMPRLRAIVQCDLGKLDHGDFLALRGYVTSMLYAGRIEFDDQGNPVLDEVDDAQLVDSLERPQDDDCFWSSMPRAATQGCFFPVTFPDDGKLFGEGGIVVASRTDGEPLVWEDVQAAMKGTFTWAELRRPKVSGADAKNHYRAAKEHGEAVALAHVPFEFVPEEVWTKGLYSLPPGLDYSVWAQVCMAMTHYFNHQPTAIHERGKQLFIEWSASEKQVCNFSSPEDAEAEWEKYRYRNYRNIPFTLRQLLRLFEGLDADVMVRWAMLCRDWYLGTIAESDADWIEFKLPRQVAIHPLLRDNRISGPLLQAGAARLKELGSPTALKHLNAALKADTDTLKRVDDSRTSLARDRADSYAYVENRGEFFELNRRKWLTPRQVSEYNADVPLPEDEGTDFAGYMLRNNKCHKAKEADYRPDMSRDVIFLQEHNGAHFPVLNTYRDTSVVARPDRAEEAKGVWRTLVEPLFGDTVKGRQHLRVFEQFIAYTLQNSGSKVNWAILIRSTTGVGKNLMGRMIVPLFGEGNCHPGWNGRTLHESTNNEWQCMGQLLFLNEVKIGRTKDELLAWETIKIAVTDGDIMVRRMRRDPEAAKTRTNFIFFSNNYDALPLDEEDRRFYCVDCPETRADADARFSGQYYKSIAPLVPGDPDYRSELSGGLKAYFMGLSLAGFDKGKPPVSTDKDMFVLASGDPLYRAIRGAMDTDPLIRPDLVSMSHLKQVLGYRADVSDIDMALRTRFRLDKYAKTVRKLGDHDSTFLYYDPTRIDPTKLHAEARGRLQRWEDEQARNAPDELDGLEEIDEDDL